MDAMTEVGRERLWTHARLLMLTATFEGKILAANPAWTNILGWPVGDIVEASFFDFIHPDDVDRTIAEARALSVEGYQVPKFQNRYRTKTGGYRDIDWTAISDGEFIHALGRDNTEEMAHAGALASAEEAMRQAQKMEAIGQLTGGVAHDFNNLLTVIRGSVDLLKRNNLSEERRQKYIDSIADTADRASKLTSQLLAFARRQALVPKIIDVGASIAEVAGMVRTLTGSRIELIVKLPRQALFALADRSQLDTAVVNLAINARDAMRGEGQLTITVGAVSNIPERRKHMAVAGDFVAITVADTGMGIGPDDLSRIFEPFFTTKAVGQGTGLGLSQVIGFAKQSGGDVSADNRAEGGAVLTLYLPRADAVAAEEAVVETRLVNDGTGACILVVEDNRSVGDFAISALQELGHDCVLVSDGELALAQLAKDTSHFDVVFSDVVMPGISGLELAERVRVNYPRIPVILTSGYSHVLAANGDHGFELLHKPYSLDQLSRVLRKALAWRESLLEDA